MLKLKRFWFEFDPSEVGYSALHLGCGVTAWSYDDAIIILEATVFNGRAIPAIKKAEDIDVSTLEANHVLPNTLPSNVRGIWYPVGSNWGTLKP